MTGFLKAIAVTDLSWIFLSSLLHTMGPRRSFAFSHKMLSHCLVSLDCICLKTNDYQSFKCFVNISEFKNSQLVYQIKHLILILRFMNLFHEIWCLFNLLKVDFCLRIKTYQKSWYISTFFYQKIFLKINKLIFVKKI